MPESGHPLEQEGRKRPREEEEEERRATVVRRKEEEGEEEDVRKGRKREEEEDRRGEKREVVLQPVPPAQGNPTIKCYIKNTKCNTFDGTLLSGLIKKRAVLRKLFEGS